MASPRPRDPPITTTILLIGSTGHGKSTLGNFLLDPEEEESLTQRKPQVFKTGTSNAPETQEVRVGYSRRHAALSVIDTPGLNEDASKDLRHMIDIIRALREREQVSACILCFKFDAKIDAQYKATIAYYRNLLPALFEGNVLIVLTNYATDKRTVKTREMQGIDVDKVVSNTVQEIKDGASLTYEPQVFLIDSLPLDMDSDDKGREISKSTRAAILSYIETMQPIKVEDLKVAKTDALKQRDSEEIKVLDGEIHGYNVRLKQANAKAEEALGEIESEEKKRFESDRQLLRWREKLQDKDSSQHVTAAEWSLKEWKFPQAQWQEENIEWVLQWPVVAQTTWYCGHLRWESFISVTGNVASGKVKGEFCHGLYANVTLKTTKSHKYAKEIAHLKDNISKAETKSGKERCEAQQECAHEERCEAQQECAHEERCEAQQECAHDIKLLQDYIREKNKEKVKLSSDYMTLGEAERRIADLQKK